jgi:hypothetical protein
MNWGLHKRPRRDSNAQPSDPYVNDARILTPDDTGSFFRRRRHAAPSWFRHGGDCDGDSGERVHRGS